MAAAGLNRTLTPYFGFDDMSGCAKVMACLRTAGLRRLGRSEELRDSGPASMQRLLWPPTWGTPCSLWVWINWQEWGAFLQEGGSCGVGGIWGNSHRGEGPSLDGGQAQSDRDTGVCACVRVCLCVCIAFHLKGLHTVTACGKESLWEIFFRVSSLLGVTGRSEAAT